MKFKEYLDNIKKLYEEHGDIEVFYSIDDEGNDYKKVYYNPSFNYIMKDNYEYYLVPEEEVDEDNIKDLTKVIIVN